MKTCDRIVSLVAGRLLRPLVILAAALGVALTTVPARGQGLALILPQTPSRSITVEGGSISLPSIHRTDAVGKTATGASLAGGSVKVTIDSSGNVGIGTTSPTQAWRNFLDSILNPYAPAATVNIELAAALAEYGAVWLRSENAIEFESQEKAVLWVLRWS